MAGEYRLPLRLLLDLDVSVVDRLQQLTEAMEQHNTLWLVGRWQDLGQYAAHLGGLAELISHQIAARTVLGRLEREKLAAGDRESREFFAGIRDSNSTEAQAAREQLLEDLIEELGDPVLAEEERDRLLDGNGVLFEQARQFDRHFDEDEERLVDAFVRLRVLMANAEFVSLFQQAGRRTRMFDEEVKSQFDGFPGIRLASDDIGLITGQAGAVQQMVETGYSRLFDALGDGVPIEDFRATVAAQYEALAPLSGLMGRLLGSYVQLAQQTEDPEERRTQLRRALEATEWKSRAGLLHAYTAYLRANVQTRGANRWYAFEKQRAASRALPSAAPQGSAVSVQQIIQDGSLVEGEMFQVEGVVANLRIEDDPSPPKFSSFFELADPVSGSVVLTRAHMFSLRNNGVSDGAYCRLNGFLRRAEPWLDNGAVGLDIDRVNLTELRKGSWIDDITHRMRPYYRLYLDEMNMFYTHKLEEG